MIAGDDDDRVVLLAGFLQDRECLADLAVEPLDGEVIVGDVGANRFMVREAGREFDP